MYDIVTAILSPVLYIVVSQQDESSACYNLMSNPSEMWIIFLIHTVKSWIMTTFFMCRLGNFLCCDCE
jgi:hypothetical protein